MISDSSENTGRPAVKSGAGTGAGIGLLSCVALVVANMIGSGVFTTSGFAMADLGNRPLVMLAWLIGGAIAICGAISYGGLVRHITESGGEYLFLSRTVHPLAGFLAGWVSLVAGFTGAIAFAALGFAEYAAPDHPEYNKAIAIGIIVLFGLLHLVKDPGIVLQNVIVATKLAMVVGLVALAASNVSTWPGIVAENVTNAPFQLGTFATTVMWVSLSYSGFNASVYIASEVRDARTTVPSSMWLATSIVTVLYLALNFVFVYGPEPGAIVGQPKVALIAAQAVRGGMLSTVVQLVICLALASSVSAMVLAGPRVYSKMADDGVFPRIFQFRSGNASVAILLQVILAAVCVLISSLQDLLTYLSLVLSLSTAATVASLFLLHRRDPAVRSFGYPIIPAIYLMATLGLAACAVQHRISTATPDSKWQLIAAVATLVVGIAAYYVQRVFDSGDESGP